MTENRRFIRHPADIPIEFAQTEGEVRTAARARDVSLGGLAFEAERCPESDHLVELCIPGVEPEFRTLGRVVWCRDLGGRYEVGVEFLEPSDAYRARMVEQVCHIEQYRRRVREEEGRELTGDDAAREWIGKFAAGFPE
jgi:hypothetical protein